MADMLKSVEPIADPWICLAAGGAADAAVAVGVVLTH